MIYEVKEYWVYNGLPSVSDLMDARDIAKKGTFELEGAGMAMVWRHISR